MIWLATLGYSGRLPAGGTCGSLIALVLFIPITFFINWQVQLLLVLLVSIIGVPICQHAANRLGDDDPSAVVWDELAGMWLALIALPADPLWWILSFSLFRLFDIVKPWPVGWCDSNLKGGLGIMADDLVAAIMVQVLLQTVIFLAL